MLIAFTSMRKPGKTNSNRELNRQIIKYNMENECTDSKVTLNIKSLTFENIKGYLMIHCSSSFLS